MLVLVVRKATEIRNLGRFWRSFETPSKVDQARQERSGRIESNSVHSTSCRGTTIEISDIQVSVYSPSTQIQGETSTCSECCGQCDEFYSFSMLHVGHDG